MRNKFSSYKNVCMVHMYMTYLTRCPSEQMSMTVHHSAHLSNQSLTAMAPNNQSLITTASYIVCIHNRK